jgi:hypothetical protein
MAPKTVSVTNKSDDVYSGYDHGYEAVGLGLPPSIVIEPGESADVSEEKAAQLKADHPDWFGEKKSRGGKQSAGASTDDVED